jgi:hypothetical protein
MTLEKEKYVIDWLEFILTSVEHKWKLRGTLKKIENSMYDVYGKEFSEPIIKELYFRCEKYINDL